MSKSADYLFAELHQGRYGDNRRIRPLFLPRLLDRFSDDKRITEDSNYKKAYEIVCKWAELESSGRLIVRKESNIEVDFIHEVFEEALGYTPFSQDKDNWQIEPKYSLAGGCADAAIGLFSHKQKPSPHCVVELKGPNVNVDRDRFDGRTTAQQCWDYLYSLPDCQWGMVCNFVSFRLYNRNHTPRVYELFTLQDLRRPEVFRWFYYIFQRDGLLPSKLQQRPRADILLEQTINHEKEIGDTLYNHYSRNRRHLIDYLRKEPFHKTLEQSIRIAQKLLDRVIFIAFCEDRDLLPPKLLKRAWEDTPPFSRVTNPKWQNFLNLFRSIDKGDEKEKISPFNGGLFRSDPLVDNLDIDDEKTDFFKNIGDYDFRDEVNVDILGHLFERSVHDIERIRYGDLFGEPEDGNENLKMSKSAERKRFGIYYTPPDFTDFIVENTIAKVIGERFGMLADKLKINRQEAEFAKPDSKYAKYWQGCLEILRDIKVVDPACGSGAFLIKAFDILEECYIDVYIQLEVQKVKGLLKKEDITDIILASNIFGVDLSAEAIEITQLALWVRSANKGKTLADLSDNIICANSLIFDSDVNPKAIDWEKAFPEVFSRPTKGFDCVIGNPPWERMKLQEREFFDGRDSKIATANNASARRKLIEKLEKKNPELFALYQQALKESYEGLDYVRSSRQYPLAGRGDINTYAVFAELAYKLVAKNGIVGLLVPSGIATDNTTKNFFSALIDQKRLTGLYDFENKAPVFADVHRSFKFSVLLFGGAERKSESIDFVFFAHTMEDLKEDKRHIKLSPDDIKLINPNTKTCPVFRSNRDCEITRAIYRRVPVLVDKNRKKGGNPWGVKFMRMFDQTNDAELFRTADDLKEQGFKRNNGNWKKAKQVYLPLYEAKMIQMYDHRAASVVVNNENWMRQGQTLSASLVEHQNPEFTIEPRWWILQDNVSDVLDSNKGMYYLAFKDVTSSTNQRTMIASFIPNVGVLNSAPLILTDKAICCRKQACLLANLNSLCYDFVARQSVGGVHLNFFIVAQLPTFTPDFYEDKCPWQKKTTLQDWISERVLKLSCTSNDMIPLAEAAGLKEKVHKWKVGERNELMAELDAAFFLLYEIKRDDVEHILSTFQGLRKEGTLGDSNTTSRILENYEKFHNKMD